MSSESGNVQAREENRGSSENNIARRQEQSRDPDKSNGRDREGARAATTRRISS